MPFPTDDRYWQEARQFLAAQSPGLTSILAPNEFLEFFPGVCHYNVSDCLPPELFPFVVIHKGMLDRINACFLSAVLDKFHLSFANAVFVIYQQASPGRMAVHQESSHTKALLELVARLPSAAAGRTDAVCTALVVTTFNRPQSLARSLPLLARLGAPLLVVDDGSPGEVQQQNRQTALRAGAAFLALPGNRGLCCAINIGVSYWLADPSIGWISVFSDDVEVQPDLLTIFAAIQDASKRPLLVGRYAPEHPVFGTETIAGRQVLYQRSCAGFPLHAHRDYWRDVLPIPTPYLGAPKPTGGRPGQGSDSDWWVGSWAPKSIAKRGGFITCVPGLVRHTGEGNETSTWTGRQ